jgi:hypothetical protein
VTDEGVPAPKIDTSVPHSARIWNYWLGGKDNYLIDREAGDKYRETYPQIVDVARAGRYFLARSVRFLAGEAGVRQFLDVGTGLPAPDNTHEIAQRVAPESRVVYVDNDPLVLAHARALLTPAPQGSCDYVDADMRDSAAILAAAARTLDLTHVPHGRAGPRVLRGARSRAPGRGAGGKLAPRTQSVPHAAGRQSRRGGTQDVVRIDDHAGPAVGRDG